MMTHDGPVHGAALSPIAARLAADETELYGDQPRSAFISDRQAHDYARENEACVYDDHYQCWSCHRWDH